MNNELVFVDVETTSLEPFGNGIIQPGAICEIGATMVKHDDYMLMYHKAGERVVASQEFRMDVNPSLIRAGKVRPNGTVIDRHVRSVSITAEALAVNGFTKSRLEAGRPQSIVLTQFISTVKSVFAGKPTLAGWNINFDVSFLKAAFLACSMDWAYFDYHYLDVWTLADTAQRFGFIGSDVRLSLGSVAEALGVTVYPPHTALGDVQTTMGVYFKLMNMMSQLERPEVPYGTVVEEYDNADCQGELFGDWTDPDVEYPDAGEDAE